MAREVGEAVGADVSARAKLEPLRVKLVSLIDPGLLRKLPRRPVHHAPVTTRHGRPRPSAPGNSADIRSHAASGSSPRPITRSINQTGLWPVRLIIGSATADGPF
ncbi:hypothetical protein GCM10010497_59650 [Streptomyces cinereoruber]|uniref:Uncharacterized protein n=1 Tax=Streptomyces cinereoruber TaxID=67260 RepID=A0AAV4KQP2_9ACTN|nr:hypothetical protein GCM10010497_59650 [Streptomyces cinereoruber]